MEISILKKFTKLCLKNNYSILKNVLLISDDNNFKVELLIVSYYALRHLCEFSELQNLNQSFQLLYKILSNSLINACHVPIMYDFDTEKINVEQKIILRANTSIKTYTTIKNYLFMAEELFFSLKKYYEEMECKMNIKCYIKFSRPINSKAVFYAFKYYQQLKSDCYLENLAQVLFRKMSIQNKQLYNTYPHIISDLRTLFCCGEDLIDVSVVASCFLSDSVMDKYEMVESLFYVINECVILASQNTSINRVLIFPFSLSLHRSLETKNDDCLFNNLAVLDNYFNFVMDKSQYTPREDRNYFLNIIFNYYKDIIHYLSNESTFVVNCWELGISPSVMDLSMLKELLKIHSSTTFSKIIEVLKMETIKLFAKKDRTLRKDYYMFIFQVWNYLLNMHKLINKNKKVLKDLIIQFCFTLNRTFLFQMNKKLTKQGLILLMKIISSLLQVSWINKFELMNCSLRIITFVEKMNISNIEVLLEAAELLIVLYKCSNNSIKPILGLYMITFTNVFKKCCEFAVDHKQAEKLNIVAPFHKLVKCSDLFKQNRDDFVFIGHDTLESLFEVIVMKNNLPEYLMSFCYKIVHNIMYLCSYLEVNSLEMNIQGQSLDTLSHAVNTIRLVYTEWYTIPNRL